MKNSIWLLGLLPPLWWSDGWKKCLQVSILASQAPTNPDLDVEEEAAERASIAQQNGTTPTDLQISCKLKINYPHIQCYFLIVWTQAWHITWGCSNKKNDFSFQRSTWLRRRRSWTSRCFAGNLSFPPTSSHRSHWRPTRWIHYDHHYGVLCSFRS